MLNLFRLTFASLMFVSSFSWIPGYTKGRKGAALLFDQDYHPKPVYKALVEVFSQYRPR